MIHYSFIAGNNFDLGLFKDYDPFLNNFPDFQTVWLKGDLEIELLTSLIGISKLS